jgi:AcrR family transcriptional regulator
MNESDKQKRILEAALDLFTDLGFHGASTASIAEKAGVAVGTLFHYFATKEDLINALYLEIKIRMRSRLLLGLDQVESLRERFEILWLNSVRWSMDRPREIHFFRLFGVSPNISQSTRQKGMQHFSFLIDLIEQGKQQGLLKNLSSDLMIDLIMSGLNAVQEHFLQFPERFKDTAYRASLFQTSWDTISKK